MAVDTGETIVNETMPGGDMSRRRQGTVEQRTVRIRNGRSAEHEFSLEEHGFEFVGHPTAMTDFFDEDQLKSTYYPEVEGPCEAEKRGKAGFMSLIIPYAPVMNKRARNG